MPERRRFAKAYDGRLIMGVCAGLAEFFRLNPWVLRAIFAALAVLTRGIFLAVYLLLGYLLPNADDQPITEHRDRAAAQQSTRRQRTQEKNERETWYIPPKE